MTAERSARFAQALTLVRPVSRRRLYWTARAALVSDPAQVKTFDAVFDDVFGSRPDEPAPPPEDAAPRAAPADERPAARRAAAGEGGAPTRRPGAAPGDGEDAEEAEVPVPVAASDEELLRDKRFDALEPAELAQLYRLMTRLRIATPAPPHARARARPPRRAHRPAPHAARQPAHRRRPDPPRAPAPPRSRRGGSCCSATSRARWSPTRARTCSSSPARPARAARRRRSCSPRA